jgi:hypothetical protein
LRLSQHPDHHDHLAMQVVEERHARRWEATGRRHPLQPALTFCFIAVLVLLAVTIDHKDKHDLLSDSLGRCRPASTG